MERCIEFLADELKVIQAHEAENRVFFVSAREVLVSRVNQDKGTPTPSGSMLDGFQSRLFEFASFEHKFEVNCDSIYIDQSNLFTTLFTIYLQLQFKTVFVNQSIKILMQQPEVGQVRLQPRVS